ncbi:DUF354 domain-containing protein [Candidatus Poribacteria bacterium]|nr:DUF354 domain-containing protein [Candidatus Poribacteria bacterium]
MTDNKRYLWFDFENAPHVLILSPIIRHFQDKGYECILTARNFSCTVGLCKTMGYNAQVVGKSGTAKTKLGKSVMVLKRSGGLYRKLWRKPFSMAMSHGSRSQALAAHTMKMPVISMDDYEHSYQGFTHFADYILVPFPINPEIWGKQANKVIHYPGLKEELYLQDFTPDKYYLHKEVGENLINNNDILVLLRPSGRWSHYRSEKSVEVQRSIMELMAQNENVFMILIPRDKEQKQEMAEFCQERNIRYYIPKNVLNGPQLIWNMDMVISGGGTMTREAAVLGVPSYSFFGGKPGAVDNYLEEEGKLISIREPAEIDKIKLEKRHYKDFKLEPKALDFVIAFVQEVINNHA